MQEKVQINCSGGGLRLSDGTCSFYIELSINGVLVEFESEVVFTDEDLMVKKLRSVIDKLPVAVGDAAKLEDVTILEAFCEKWGIYKVRPEDTTREMDASETESSDGETLN